MHVCTVHVLLGGEFRPTSEVFVAYQSMQHLTIFVTAKEAVLENCASTIVDRCLTSVQISE